MKENMPVPEFNEKEIELINLLKEKGFCPETQELFGAWQDTELVRPEWEEARNSTADTSLILQAELDFKKAKMLNMAEMYNEAEEAAMETLYQTQQMTAAGIDCQILAQQARVFYDALYYAGLEKRDLEQYQDGRRIDEI